MRKGVRFPKLTSLTPFPLLALLSSSAQLNAQTKGQVEVLDGSTY